MDQASHKIGPRPLEIQRRLRNLSEEAFGLVCVLDAEGRLAYMNPSMLHSLGILKDEWERVQFQSYVHPADHRVFLAGFGQWAAKPGEHSMVKIRLVSKDGQIIPFDAAPHNLLDDAGVQGFLLCTKTSNRFQGSAQRLDLLELAISEAHDAVLVANAGEANLASAEIEYTNPAMQRLLEDPGRLASSIRQPLVQLRTRLQQRRKS